MGPEADWRKLSGSSSRSSTPGAPSPRRGGFVAYSPPTPKPKAPPSTPQPAKPAAGPPKPVPAPIPRPGQTPRPGGTSAQPKPGQPKPASPKPGALKPVGGAAVKPQGSRTPLGLKLPATAVPRIAGTTQAKPGRAKPKTAKPAIQPAVPRLTDSQVKSAQDWYASRAKQYTPQVLKEIQQKLGLPKTGKADAATVQGIAKWQAGNKPLPIGSTSEKFPLNGKADAELLNHMFPSGLARPEIAMKYTQEFKNLMSNWVKLDAEQRKNGLETLVNRTLSGVGVPEIEVIEKKMNKLSSGSYSFVSREMSINKSLYLERSLTKKEQIELANTLYHESRHAEQGYNMVRLNIPNNVMRGPTTPRSVINSAVKKPIDPGSIDGIKTQAIYDSVNGPGKKHREETLEGLSDPTRKLKIENLEILYQKTSDKLTGLLEKKLNLTPGTNDIKLEKNINKTKIDLKSISMNLDGLYINNDKIYSDYIHLPEESDAWRTGGKINDNYGQ